MLAADPSLLLDLNTQPDPNSLSNRIGEVRSFGSLGFVEIESAATGRELWRTDGTAAGTFLLKDINPGRSNSSIGDIVDVAGVQYFNVYGDVSGLYRTDGTAVGTYQLLPQVVDGLTALGTVVIFAASDLSHGHELWVSDGTVSGTTLLRDINPGAADSGVQSIISVGNRLLFQATTALQGAELWQTDGTAIGTHLVEDIVAGSDGSFATPTTGFGNGAIVGTADGGFRFYDASSGTLGSTLPFPETVFSWSYQNLGNSLVFIGLDSSGGSAIWRTDGTVQGTQSLVTNPTSNIYGINVIRSSQSTVYFSVPSSNNAADLYAISTQGPAVKLLGDANTAGYTISQATPAQVLIETIKLDSTNQFTVSDGTLAGTSTLAANPGIFARGGLFYSVVQGHRVYFSGYSSVTGTSHPWVFDFNSQQFTSLAGISNTFRQRDFNVINGGVAWLAEDVGGYRFQFSSDGVTASDASPEFASSASVAVVNGSAIVPGIISDGATLLALNQGVSSTLVQTIPTPTLSTSSLTWPNSPINVNGYTFFLADHNGARTLWRTDGTSAGTISLSETNTYDSGDRLFGFNGKAYLFRPNSSGTNTEVLSSDGSVAGTVSESIGIGGRFLGVAGGRFLVFNNGTLYASNGTSAGTRAVAVINNSAFGVTTKLELGSDVYFTSIGNNSQSMLWKSDGTTAGTYVLNSNEPSGRFYYNSGSTILIADQNGNISKSQDGLVSEQMIGTVTATPQQLLTVNGVIFVATLQYATSTYRIERLERNGLPSTVVGTFTSEVALLDLAGRLAVAVNASGNSDIWTETANGLTRDTQLSDYGFNGPATLRRFGNQLLGLKNFLDFGYEPGVFNPDSTVSLSNRTVAENLPPTVVGQLSAQWINTAATVVNYNLIAGAGDSNNADFAVSGSGQLSTTHPLDYEAGTTRSIRVRATLSSGQLIESTLLIYVQNERDTFQNPQLSNQQVAEDAAIGQLVGIVSAEPIVGGGALTYQLVSVDGNAASSQFVVSGNQLRLNQLLDFEAMNSYTVAIRIASSSSTFTQVVTFKILVGNVNENAASQIVISNDHVIENNGFGESIGLLGVRNNPGPFAFSLTSGPGDYDNSQFEVRNGTLVLNDTADFETRTNYSVRISATGSSGTVSAALTIDVLGVDESSGIIRLIDSNGEPISYLAIEENTPVGTSVATIRVVDNDRDDYELSGSGGLFTQYLQIQGDQLVVANPINFEAITNFRSLYLMITARSLQSSQLTQYFQSASDTETIALPIININDPPVVSRLSDQLANESEFNAFDLPNPLAVDEDGNLSSISLTANGAPLPNWLSFNSTTNQLLATPAAVDVGTYLIRVTATDSMGDIGAATFTLTVQDSAAHRFQGTAGDDSFVIRPAIAAANIWVVLVNGRQVYRGAFDNANSMAVDGLAGNDTISIQATTASNQFLVSNDSVLIDLARIRTTNIENREIRGLGGDDTFQVVAPSAASVSRFAVSSTVQSPTTLFGGNGIDTLVAGNVDNEWTLSGQGQGTLNNIAFNHFENLIGGTQNDRFNMQSQGRIVGTIDGRGGLNSIEYASRNGNVEIDLNLSAAPTGTATSIGDFANINSFVSTGNSQSTIKVVTGIPGVATNWNVYDNYVLVAGLIASGFDRLVGSDSNDDFHFWNSSQRVEIQGRGGVNHVQHEGVFSSVIVDLQKHSGTGITKFSDITRFESATFDSEVRGLNQDTVWSVLSDRVSNSQNNEFVNYGRIVGGSRSDTFIVAADFASGQSLSGGDGSDTLRSIDIVGPKSNALWTLTNKGSGTMNYHAFDSVENLEGRADSDAFDFVTEVPSVVWFDAISGWTNGESFLSYRQTIAGTEVVLDLQRQTVNGVRRWATIQSFGGRVGSDRILGRNDNVAWLLNGNGGQSSDGLTGFRGFDTIVGGKGDDVFSVIGSNIDLPLRVQGGQGRNTLDFSRHTAAVVVDLQIGNATPFGLGVTGIQDVIGSAYDDYLSGDSGNNVLFGFDGNDTIFGQAGDDVLLGGKGNDYLSGNGGNDILVGGSGADKLYGGAGSDLLISGATNVLVDETLSGVNSLNQSAIQDVQNEWSSSRTYQQRTANLRTGVGSSNSIKLNASSITTDSAVDEVFGEAGDDWFWIGMNDLATDVNTSRESLIRLT